MDNNIRDSYVSQRINNFEILIDINYHILDEDEQRDLIYSMISCDLPYLREQNGKFYWSEMVIKFRDLYGVQIDKLLCSLMGSTPFQIWATLYSVEQDKELIYEKAEIVEVNQGYLDLNLSEDEDVFPERIIEVELEGEGFSVNYY